MTEPEIAATTTLNADEFYLDDEMFDGNDEQIDGLKDRLRCYVAAALQVVGDWEQGDLAAAVRGLDVLLRETIDVPTADIPYDHPMFGDPGDPDYDADGNLKPGVDNV